MSSETKSVKLYRVLILVVFIVALSLRIYWIEQKQGLHVDEIATHYVGTTDLYSWRDLHDTYHPKKIETFWHTLQNETDVHKNLKILAGLRKDNHGDITHTNLHYSIYRIWTAFSQKDSFTLKEFIWNGCLLNLIFFSISFIFMYKLLRLVFKDEKYIPLSLAAAFLNTGGISNTLFIRCYALQETMFVIFAYYFVKLWYCVSKKTTAKFTIALCLTMMTGYFAQIYTGILSIALFIRHAYDAVINNAVKNFKSTVKAIFDRVQFLLYATIFASILCVILYEHYFGYFDTIYTNDIIDNLNNISISHFWMTKIRVTSLYVHYIIYVVLLPFIIIAAAANSKAKADRVLLILILLTILWGYAVMHITPHFDARFILAACPIIALLGPYMLSKLSEKVFNPVQIIYVLILFLYAIFPIPQEASGHPNCVEIPNNIFRSNIEYTFMITK